MDPAKSYATRIKGLQKKIKEFSTLVDVDACMLVYGGPKQGNHPQILSDTHPKPQDSGDLIRILVRYLSLPKQERTKRHENLSNVSGDGGRNKIDDDNSSEQNSNADGLEWDDRFDKLSADQIQQLIDSVDAKIETIDEKIQLAERTAENPSCMTSRSSDHVVGAAPTSWGGNTCMQQMQPVYVLQPFNQNFAGQRPMNLDNGSGMVPMVMQMPMMAVQPGGGNQMPMMADQPGGGNQMVFGNHQGPVTYFMPQAFVQPMPTSSYIPNLMPRGDA